MPGQAAAWQVCYDFFAERSSGCCVPARAISPQQARRFNCIAPARLETRAPTRTSGRLLNFASNGELSSSLYLRWHDARLDGGCQTLTGIKLYAHDERAQTNHSKLKGTVHA